MLKILRTPERLYALAMWLLSLVFAAFLVGLGGKIVGDLPKVEAPLSQEAFADPQVMRATRQAQQEAHDRLPALEEAAVRARQEALTAQARVDSFQADYQRWLAARTSTADPRHDPEVLMRVRELEALNAQAREAATAQAQAERAQLLQRQAADQAERRQAEALRAAEGPWRRAAFQQELRVFGYRLALTLPLLLAAGWMVARRRASSHWPLMRGFVLFALFTFFVELVPYLPSWGGYVRHAVGVLATLAVGHQLIRRMQAFLARRRAEELESEGQRRERLGPELALKRMQANVCPSCERPILTTGEVKADYCVHCGITLFDRCGACSTRKNVFFRFCPQCGTGAAALGTRPALRTPQAGAGPGAGADADADAGDGGVAAPRTAQAQGPGGGGAAQP